VFCKPVRAIANPPRLQLLLVVRARPSNLSEGDDTTMTHVVTPAEEREAEEDLKVSPDELSEGGRAPGGAERTQ